MVLEKGARARGADSAGLRAGYLRSGAGDPRFGAGDSGPVSAKTGAGSTFSGTWSSSGTARREFPSLGSRRTGRSTTSMRRTTGTETQETFTDTWEDIAGA
jgi:hypothetical protein